MAVILVAGCASVQMQVVFPDMESAQDPSLGPVGTEKVVVEINPTRGYEYPGGEAALSARLVEHLESAGVLVSESGPDYRLQGDFAMYETASTTPLVGVVAIGQLIIPLAPIVWAIPAYQRTYGVQANLQLVNADSGDVLFDETFEHMEETRYSMYNSMGAKKPDSKLNTTFRRAADVVFEQVAERVAEEVE